MTPAFIDLLQTRLHVPDVEAKMLTAGLPVILIMVGAVMLGWADGGDFSEAVRRTMFVVDDCSPYAGVSLAALALCIRT